MAPSDSERGRNDGVAGAGRQRRRGQDSMATLRVRTKGVNSFSTRRRSVDGDALHGMIIAVAGWVWLTGVEHLDNVKRVAHKLGMRFPCCSVAFSAQFHMNAIEEGCEGTWKSWDNRGTLSHYA